MLGKYFANHRTRAVVVNPISLKSDASAIQYILFAPGKQKSAEADRLILGGCARAEENSPCTRPVEACIGLATEIVAGRRQKVFHLPVG